MWSKLGHSLWNSLLWVGVGLLTFDHGTYYIRLRLMVRFGKPKGLNYNLRGSRILTHTHNYRVSPKVGKPPQWQMSFLFL